MERITADHRQIYAFSAYLKESEKSAATVEKYVRDVCVFYAFVGDREIDKQAVLDYKAYLGNHYAVASANSMIAALNAFLRYCGAGELAVKRFAVQRNIFCEEQKELTREEYFRLIAAANKRRNERLSLIIQTICGTGIRVSELQYITVEAVQRGEATVAEAASGYHFVRWYNADTNATIAGGQTLTMNLSSIKDIKISAEFVTDKATQTFPAVEGGSYIVSGGDKSQTITDTSVEFEGLYNVDYVLTAQPASDKKLIGWQVGEDFVASTELTYNLGKLNAGTTVYPVFKDMYVTVTLPGIVGGSYTVKATDPSIDSWVVVNTKDVTKIFEALTDVEYTVTVSVDYLYDFNQWVDAAGNHLSSELTLTGVKFEEGSSVSPRFAYCGVTQELPVVSGGRYIVQAQDKTGDKYTVDKEDLVCWGRNDKAYVFTAYASYNYRFLYWVNESGAIVSTDTEYIVNQLSLTAVITPVFAYNYVTQVFPAVKGGSYTITDGTDTITITDQDMAFETLYNASFTVTLGTLEDKYVFVCWVDENGTPVGNGNTYTFEIGKHESVRPLFNYTGKGITLAPVIGGGSYDLMEGDTTVASSGSAEITFERNSDKEYKLVATPAEGYMFVRWQTKDGKVISKSATYESEMPDSVQAVFAKTDSAVYVVSGVEYYFLDEALAAAAKGTSSAAKTVVVTNSESNRHGRTLTGVVYGLNGTTEFVIPSNVTFIVPHDASRNTLNGSGSAHPYAIESKLSDMNTTAYTGYAYPTDGYANIELIVPSGVQITVNGKMGVGGTTNGVQAIAYGRVHANVKLEKNATIVVNNILSSCGFIYGEGTVDVKNSGTLYTPFTVDDFKGGGYTVGVAAALTTESFDVLLKHPSGEAAILPFSRYSMMSVQCTQIINYGGTVMGYVDLYAGGGHNNTTVKIFGTNEADALFALKSSDAKATITYDANDRLSDALTSKGNIVGRTKIVLEGDTSLGGLNIALNIKGVVAVNLDSTRVAFPIPYNYEIEIKNGTFNVPYNYKLLPGATIRVDQGAVMNVTGTLTVYDGLADFTTCGHDWLNNQSSSKTLTIHQAYLTKYGITAPNYNVQYAYLPYPSTAELTSRGFCGGGELIVNGTLNIKSSSKFGGIIQTEGNTGVINVEYGATLSTKTQMGGVGYWQYTILGAGFGYELAGATVRTLKAQIYNASTGKLEDLKAKIYYATAANYTVNSYKFDLYYAASSSSLKYQTVTESADIAMSGAWCAHTPGAAATCTDPQLCTTCNAVIAPKTGHTEATREENRVEATCGKDGSYNLVTYCSVCNAVIKTENKTIPATGNHTWVAADCDTPKTCSVCGATEGEALGHTWVDADCDTPKTCSVCKATEGEALGHTWVDADCNTPKTCSVCKATEGEALGHTWTDANCTAPKTCSVCKATEGEALGHAWVDADCDTPKTCSVCDATEGEALGHKYDAVVTDPTCTEAGYTTHTCSACGDTYKDSDVAAKGHTPAEAVEEKRIESTCTVAGSYDSVVKCSECGEELSRTTKALELAAHTEGAVVVENEKAATCTAEGSYDNVVYCTVCNAQLSRNTVTVEKIAHAPAEAVEENRIDSTCTVAGSYDEVVYCSVCSEQISRETTELELADHTPAAAVEENRIESTCTVAGSYDEVVYCSACNGELSRESKALELAAHTEVILSAQPATCTAKGKTEGLGCSVCNAVLVAQEEISATGHSMQQVSAAVAPSCETTGATAILSCKNGCGKTEGGEPIPALGHSYDEGVVTTEPTCTNAGVKTFTCGSCGDTKTESIEETGHSYNAGVVTIEPSCTSDGVKTFTCSCGDSYTETISAAGHTEVVDQAVAPTCTATGLTEGSHCDTCGEILVAQTVVNVTEHSYVDGECTVCGAKDPNAEQFIPEIGYGSTTEVTTEVNETTGTVVTTFKAGSNVNVAPTVTITSPEGGWRLGEENTFTVSSGEEDIACVVIVKVGDTFTRLPVTTTDGVHSFTGTLTDGCEIIVAVMGDLDGDGIADSADVMLISRSRLSENHGAYQALSTLAAIVGDLDGDGIADSADVMLISRSRLSENHGAYQKIKWKY